MENTGKIEREVAYLLRGWEEIKEEDRTEFQREQYEGDKVEALRLAKERAQSGTLECPENQEAPEHYGALEPEERKDLPNGS